MKIRWWKLSLITAYNYFHGHKWIYNYFHEYMLIKSSFNHTKNFIFFFLSVVYIFLNYQNSALMYHTLTKTRIILRNFNISHLAVILFAKFKVVLALFHNFLTLILFYQNIHTFQKRISFKQYNYWKMWVESLKHLKFLRNSK